MALKNAVILVDRYEQKEAGKQEKLEMTLESVVVPVDHILRHAHTTRPLFAE